MRLYERVYSARILETPLKEEVVKQIEIGLTEAGIGSTDQLSEDASEDPATSHAHNLAYYRLRDTGWLTEGTEKWRVYVDMNPDAFMVLGAIVSSVASFSEPRDFRVFQHNRGKSRLWIDRRRLPVLGPASDICPTKICGRLRAVSIAISLRGLQR